MAWELCEQLHAGVYARRARCTPPRLGSPFLPLSGEGTAEEFAGTLSATTHAPAAIAHEMKNAVHGSRVVGAARIAGPQTRSVKRLSIPASAMAASRG